MPWELLKTATTISELLTQSLFFQICLAPCISLPALCHLHPFLQQLAVTSHTLQHLCPDLSPRTASALAAGTPTALRVPLDICT